MIIMINGAFGSGKTTVAEALVQRIPNALLFDPEEVGFMLRKILDQIDPQPEDFQHYALWRTLVIETARLIQEKYICNLIVPMTIWRKDYFNEISRGFKKIDPAFSHFCLIAPVSTIRERLLQRGEEPNSWAERQAANCTAAFESADFEIKIDTTNKEASSVIEAILEYLSLK